MRLFFFFIAACWSVLCPSLPLNAADSEEFPTFNDITAEEGGLVGEIKTPAIQQESFSVVLKPRREAILSAEVDGRVEQIVKEFGQSFRKGQTLIRLNSSLYRLRLQKAQATEALEQTTFDTISRLYQNKSRSIIDLEEARANLSIARTELAFANHNFARCTISAPYNGRVERLAVNEQEWVNAGDPLLKIVGDGTLLARTLVPANYLSAFAVGKPVEIILTGGKKVAGKVSHLGAVMDSASQTFEIDVEVTNPDGTLISGMTGRLVRPENDDE